MMKNCSKSILKMADDLPRVKPKHNYEWFQD